MEEVWKDIEGYEGLYQVSNKGNVKSLKNNKGKYKEKLLKQSKESNGYLKVTLRKKYKKKTYLVHRLVAKAFIENPNKLPCVNHKDECKTNNVVSNLEWCTYKYNSNYGTHIKRVSESQINDPNKSKQVYQYTKDGELISVWKSTSECGRNGYNFGNVASCCRNCYKIEGNNVYKGYIWSYTPLNNKSS